MVLQAPYKLWSTGRNEETGGVFGKNNGNGGSAGNGRQDGHTTNGKGGQSPWTVCSAQANWCALAVDWFLDRQPNKSFNTEQWPWPTRSHKDQHRPKSSATHRAVTTPFIASSILIVFVWWPCCTNEPKIRCCVERLRAKRAWYSLSLAGLALFHSIHRSHQESTKYVSHKYHRRQFFHCPTNKTVLSIVLILFHN